MPPPSSRMTKNQERNFRYRPGKAETQEPESDDESVDDDEEESQPPSKAVAPPPKASTFPKKLTVDVRKLDQQTSSVPQRKSTTQDEDLEGFVTASESSEGEGEEQGSSEGEDSDDSEEEESSSEDEPKKPMLAPKFISKAQRNKQQSSQPSKSAEEIAAEEEERRKEKADELLKAQLERDAASRAANKKAWDDDEDAIQDEVDDTDGLDPEAEHAAWKLRELKRVRRDRLAIEEKEKEREEIERRRNMTAEEREAEDKAFIEAQNEEREGKGKMAFMQKYYHKGAFFQGDDEMDDEVKAAMSRDLAGARYVDETASKEVLPEYMRIRDMSKLGKKGRTRYKDMRSEDTGRWGTFDGRQRRDENGLDERFRSDDRRDGGREITGANSAPVGERRKRNEDDHDRFDKRARHD